ncbi:MAG: sigma-70 family RNA polymerase sigma factor [Verrucomicrobia bacterium]|nr:sigma-70 family RNA polymerase sigma factor [Verrucomicrobiota bacterium]
MTDSQQLLREYIESSSDSAFRELVGRYIDLVYSVALRRTDQDTRIAEDIAQTVFTDLAKKAGTLPAEVMLGGWLHQHTCFVTANVVRGEKRRQAREQQAFEMNMLHEDSDENWKQLAPVLDDAIQELAPAERDAVVLRFFEKHDFRSVGAALGVSDDTAQKRVSRALEKLRELLVQRGVTMGVVALGTALADRSIYAAPGGLSATIANSIELSQAASGVARTSGNFARLAVVTAVVALLLIVLLHPEVSGKLRALLGTKDTNGIAEVQSAVEETPGPTAVESSTVTRDTNARIQSDGTGKTDTLTNTNVLRLTIVADDSGKPVPNVPLAIRYLNRDNFKMHKLVANRLGVCDVPLFDPISGLQIITQIEGFADTRLLWNVDRGQSIPPSYTVRLIRPVRIAGQVIDPDGKPVAGAKVSFGHQEYADTSLNPVESHRFGWIAIQTDNDGRWEINRIAPGMIREISGSASHPDYIASSTDQIANNTELEKSLRDGTHVFRLGRALSIRGIVQDAEGNRVPDAKVLCGERNMFESSSSKTGGDGTFTIKGVKPGNTILSAETKGFAATTIPVEITHDDQEFTLTLQTGKTLRMRVVGPEGEPVTKAHVWLETMSHNLEVKDSNTPPVQASFDGETDDSGRLTWNSAPDRELEFHIGRSGYMSAREVKLRPREEEHVIMMQHVVTVTGTVQDAATGRDIPKFHVICGWPGPDGPNWSRFDRDWLYFEGGKFKHSFREPLIFGTKNPGYVLKVEAEGYEPFISRTISPKESIAHFEVRLSPAITPLITVLLPNGQLATQADVGFVSANSQLEIKAGGFDRENIRNPAALSQTDNNGKFRLPGDPTIFRVVIAHALGCAEITPADLLSNPIVHLQPWGRLEGTYHSGSKAVEGREFKLEFGFAKADAISYSFSKRVKTDADGKFVFPQVLPGTHKIIMLIHQKVDERSSSFANQAMQEVEIESGQTTIVELGGTGYTVQATLQFPPGIERSGIQVIAYIHTPYPMPPSEIMTDRKALLEWRQIPEIAEQLSKVKNFRLVEQPDGMWLAENVSPGEYSVMIHAFRRTNNRRAEESWSGGKQQVIVPGDPATGTLNFGEITLQASPQLAPQ